MATAATEGIEVCEKRQSNGSWLLFEFVEKVSLSIQQGVYSRWFYISNPMIGSKIDGIITFVGMFE